MTPPRGPKRHRTHPGEREAVPVELDDENTPPPMEIPIELMLPESDETIAPPVRNALLAYEGKIRELTIAMSRVWEARDLPRAVHEMSIRIESMSTAMIEISRHDERIKQLMPMVRALTAHADGLAQNVTTLLERSNQHRSRDWPRMEKDVSGLTSRVQTLESTHVQTNMLVEGARSRGDSATGAIQALDKSVASLNAALTDRIVAMNAALVDRVEALENERKTEKAVARALAKRERKRNIGWSSLAGAIAALIAFVIKRLSE